ncbi:MAG TPA: adenosylcobinamide-GDP ribazoletransferase [Bradyrhizobium sp.]|uniref:adenosylcobinamide-GDP ribazoletransferase n=1 Tax=Bradyrhizobium sp. TaxID=376 RepID=UPI002C115842|nr:adenosylcobinamide-GDP ribazoletransferase [Bradyrhizobium sp.]HLZ06020.1 adenosylcobinamide-GDP ribazoletransferase [Bradyrhizobium sp.]
MTDYKENLQNLVADLRIGLSLCTRLPVGPSEAVGEGDIASASWTFPIAGLLVGLVGTLVYWIAVRTNTAPQPAAALTLAAILLLTGAMHEDGLADTADGFGGKTRERKLEIMRDSRIGTFGACALAISLLLRWSTIADIAEPRFVATALISAHVAARACLPAFMYLVPPARADGLSGSAGQPPFPSVIAALLLGIVCLLFAFGPTGTVVTLLMLLLAALVLARLAIRQFGGQTGDVLGAMEQIAEIVVLVVAASRF